MTRILVNKMQNDTNLLSATITVVEQRETNKFRVEFKDDESGLTFMVAYYPTLKVAEFHALQFVEECRCPVVAA